MLSTETLLHIWLSTEYYGFRPSSTAVDTGGYPGFNDVKVIFRHILLFYFQNLFLGYFSFLRKAYASYCVAGFHMKSKCKQKCKNKLKT